MAEIHYISDSLQGLTHTENQDGFLILDEEKYCLFAVFDGVSCSKNPKKGVENAIKFIEQYHQRFIDSSTIRFKEMMYAANQDILQTRIPESLTTYALAGFFKEEPSVLYYSNLGDSRIYYIRNEVIHQLTTDDTLWPGSNILTKCLGGEKLLPDDFREGQYKLKEGILFLASDGCYGIWERNRKELLQIFNKSDLIVFHSYFSKLLKGYNADDATYIIVQMH